MVFNGASRQGYFALTSFADGHWQAHAALWMDADATFEVVTGTVFGGGSAGFRLDVGE
jgi:hypothetical protein